MFNFPEPKGESGREGESGKKERKKKKREISKLSYLPESIERGNLVTKLPKEKVNGKILVATD